MLLTGTHRGPLKLKSRVDPPTLIRTGHSTWWTPHYIGHLVSVDTSFHPVPISCCDFGRLGTNVLLSIYPILSLTSLPARFALYKLHFVTVCPSWNAFLMVFGLLTPQPWSHNPSPCPPCCPLIASQAVIFWQHASRKKLLLRLLQSPNCQRVQKRDDPGAKISDWAKLGQGCVETQPGVLYVQLNCLL